MRVTKKRRKRSNRSISKEPDLRDGTLPDGSTSADSSVQSVVATDTGQVAKSSTSEEESQDLIWKGPAKLPDEKTREDEFEQYLEDLLLWAVSGTLDHFVTLWILSTVSWKKNLPMLHIE